MVFKYYKRFFMLILSRKKGESIMISTDICITILKNLDGMVDVGISAPRSVSVHRLEVFNKNKIQEKRIQHEWK